MNRKKRYIYFFIGEEKLIKEDSVIGIFDIDRTTVTKRGREYLNAAQKNGRVKNAAKEQIPRSFLVSGDGNVYLSAISSQTIMQRWIQERHRRKERGNQTN